MVREAYAAITCPGFCPREFDTVYLQYCFIFFALPRLLAIINFS
jgi:hypothetical protein